MGDITEIREEMRRGGGQHKRDARRQGGGKAPSRNEADEATPGHAKPAGRARQASPPVDNPRAVHMFSRQSGLVTIGGLA